MADPYNPLHKVNLGKSVAEALLLTAAVPLGQLEHFIGAGIYAIYYRGNLAVYDRLRRLNADRLTVPIYIGKAIPSGGRKGLALLSEQTQGRYLFNRLQDHADSVRRANNLDLADFFARWLAVDDIWIPLGETLLIERFHPAWNLVLDGFGNHDPGAGRYNGLRPMWDTLHPGRPWADRCRQRVESAEELAVRVSTYLETISFPDDAHMDVIRASIVTE